MKTSTLQFSPPNLKSRAKSIISRSHSNFIISAFILLFFLNCYAIQEKKSIVVEFESILESSGVEVAIEKYRKVLIEQKDTNHESEFEALGLELLDADRINEAAKVLELTCDIFPNSWRAWEMLGEAYHLRGGMFNETMAAFQRALKLNPGNPEETIALTRLKGLGQSSQAETGDSSKYAPGENTRRTGAYLGQNPPGLEPKLFAPGIISTKGHFENSLTIAPDGKEIYFTRGRDILVCRYEKDGWKAPEIPAFAKTHPGHEMHITPDGSRLFYVRKGESGPAIWTAEKSNGGWKEPGFHSPGMFATTSKNRNFYVTGFPEGDGGSIFYAPWLNNRYAELELLGSNINTPYSEMHPCISPDESYLVFDSTRPGGEGWADFYVSFRQNDGSWSQSIRIDAITNIQNVVYQNIHSLLMILLIYNSVRVCFSHKHQYIVLDGCLPSTYSMSHEP